MGFNSGFKVLKFNVSDNKTPNTEHAQTEPSKWDAIYKKKNIGSR